MTVSRGDTEIAQSVIRRRNLSRMFNELHRRGPLTRSELALSLRVNRSTVASLIAELAARDLVSERYRDKPEVQPTPGRPSPVVEICRDGPAALALELSTDWIRAAVIGLGAWVAVSVRRDLPLASSTPGQSLDEMHEIVAPMLKGLVRGPRVVAIGVSVPGAVRAQDGHVYDAPNLGWHDVPLGSLVRRRFHELGVSVFVGNDADLATSAEQLRGSGHGAADFICLCGEGGVGAGFVVGGRSLTGAAGYAGEVGHLTVDQNGTLCHCGARGCWEAEGGEESLLRRSGRDPLGGTRALADLLSAADRGDTVGLAALSESGRWLGIGLAGLVNVFNPTRISLGGLYARIFPYVNEAVLRELDSRAMPAPRAMVELTTALLGANTLLLGAAKLALAPTLYDPTIVPLTGDSVRVYPDRWRPRRPPSVGQSVLRPMQGGVLAEQAHDLTKAV